jgi:serine/threonine protein kinase
MTEQASEQSIFLHVLGLPSPADRAAYLDEVCRDKPGLRAELNALLAAHDRLGGGLPLTTGPKPASAAPAGVTGARPAGGEDAGSVIAGRYKLVEQIGEGGMGAVWMAQQTEPVKRLVAVKLIKTGMESKQVITRFEAERQALALMDHPNIARVLDAGATATGRPYFVMELVKGVPVTRYCDEQRLTPKQRLELFVPACQAIQHAHQKGVIHRDLKPSNVLVALYDGKPVPKVIDFGVAKAVGQALTEKTLVTGFGNIVGTLEYMSPEQGELNQLDIDTRSDIYSLGVLLYELLAGSPPFTRKELEKAGVLEMLRVIREQEPTKPSTKLSMADSLPTLAANRGTEPARLTKLIRGELDWIVMKALEKDRNRRYETANGFAIDLQRYLADEPVQACPPSAWYRFRKLARRNKKALLTGLVVASALVAGTAVATWQAVLARQAQRQVQSELKEKDKQFQRAEANFLQTLQAVDGLLSEVGEKELASMPHLEQVRRRLLGKALTFFRNFLRTRGEDPTVRFEAALAYRRVGGIGWLLGQHGPAEEACGRAIEFLDALRTEEPERPLYRHELARAYLVRARLLATVLGRAEAAERDYPQALALLEDLVTNDPDRPDYQEDLGTALSRWGALRIRTGHPAVGEQLLRRSVRLMQDLANRFPDRADYAKGLARGCGSLAQLLGDVGRPDEAEKTYSSGCKVVGRALKQFGGDQDLLWLNLVLHMDHGRLLWQQGRVADAETTLREAAKVGEQLAADFPSIPRYRSDLAGVYTNLGSLLRTQGRCAEAEQPLNRAVVMANKLAADFPKVPDFRQDAGGALSNLALLLTSQSRHAEARPLLERAVEHDQAAHTLSPKNRHYRDSLCTSAGNLAGVLMALRAPANELDRAHERAIGLARALAGDYPEVAQYQSALGSALSNWAHTLKERNEPEKAVPLLEEAVARRQAALKVHPHNPEYLELLRKHYMVLAEAERSIAHRLKAQGKNEEARRFLQEAERYQREADKLVAGKSP